MDQLVNQISQQTGIPQTQTRQVVMMVVDYLKGRLPGPVAQQLDSALGGQAMGGQGTGGMFGQTQQGMGGIGDMMGQSRPQNP
jgi:hypothetical protein